jgi:putative transcriptional regulator
MKTLKAGSYIKSTPVLNGSCFEDTNILIVKHDKDGSLGFIINKPFGKSLHELIEFNYSKPFPLLNGGPVDQDHLFILHNRPDLIEGSEKLTNGLYLGGNMDQVIEAINNSSSHQQQIQIFIGYCGWDTGELEAEIEEGCWTI